MSLDVNLYNVYKCLFKSSSFSKGLHVSLSVIKPEKKKRNENITWPNLVEKQIKPKQNVLGDIYGISEVFLRKRQLQIWRAKSEVNIYLEKLEVPKNILNPSVRRYKSHLL